MTLYQIQKKNKGAYIIAERDGDFYSLLKIVFNGKEVLIPAGPSGPAGLNGPDGNPIGSIISYMGVTAPKDYLICDGAVYNIADYPQLAEFFEEQVGAKNYFGGDGAATFAVPDMRNLFLRGYHGEAEEQLSGEVGVKQEGTSHSGNYSGIQDGTNTMVIVGTGITGRGANSVKNFDSMIPTTHAGVLAASTNVDTTKSFSYISRPVNMAVLYCIKAVESVPAENVYSTEETRIGTWIDGKPIYQKTFTGSHTVLGTVDEAFIDFPYPNVDTLIEVNGSFKNAENNFYYNYPILQVGDGNAQFIYSIYVAEVQAFRMIVRSIQNDAGSFSIYYFWTFKYTKTTDQATIELPDMLSSPNNISFNLDTQDIPTETEITEIKTEEV